MYSEKIKPNVEKMFSDLRIAAQDIIVETNSVNETVNWICKRVVSETATRSKTMLSDMLFDLNDSLLQESFFANTLQLNKFTELNLRQEILSKYRFTLNTTICYKESSHIMQALKFGAGTLLIGGIGAIVVVLIEGLSLSSFVPIAFSVLITTAFGAGMFNYLVIEPNRNKKNLSQAIEKYLIESQQQLMNWFDEVEHYFHRRVDEFKKTI